MFLYTLPPLLLLLVPLALIPADPDNQRDFPAGGPPAHEVIAAAGLALIPVLAVLMGMVTHAYYHRYALPAVLGVAILLGYVAHRYTRGRQLPGVLLAAALFGYFPALVASKWDNTPSRADFERLPGVLGLSDASGPPVVVLEHQLYLRLEHYTPPSFACRLVNPSLTAARRQDNPSHTAVRSCPPLVRRPGYKVDVATFLKENPRFYVLGQLDEKMLRFVRGRPLRLVTATRIEGSESTRPNLLLFETDAAPQVAEQAPSGARGDGT
jgi:hypothetical protein